MERWNLRRRGVFMVNAAVRQRPAAMETREWKRVLEWEGEPVLSLCLQYPGVPGDAPGLRRVDRYYQRLAQHWRARWEGPLYLQARACAQALRERSRPFQPWEARLTYHITCQTETMLSLYTDAYEYAGGAHGLTTRRGDAWDLPAGLPRTLASFFPPRCPWRRLVLEQVERDIRRRLDTGESWFEPDWQRLAVREFDPERFYCTPEGPQVFYPLYSIAPYAEGIPVFPIAPPAL